MSGVRGWHGSGSREISHRWGGYPSPKVPLCWRPPSPLLNIHPWSPPHLWLISLLPLPCQPLTPLIFVPPVSVINFISSIPPDYLLPSPPLHAMEISHPHTSEVNPHSMVDWDSALVVTPSNFPPKSFEILLIRVSIVSFYDYLTMQYWGVVSCLLQSKYM